MKIRIEASFLDNDSVEGLAAQTILRKYGEIIHEKQDRFPYTYLSLETDDLNDLFYKKLFVLIEELEVIDEFTYGIKGFLVCWGCSDKSEILVTIRSNRDEE